MLTLALLLLLKFNLLILLFVKIQIEARDIFIDLGANDGTSVGAFIFGSKQPSFGIGIDGSHVNRNKLRSNVKGDKSWHVYVFEANNKHTPKLEAQRSLMLDSKAVQSYSLYNGTAISISNGTLQFVLDDPSGGDASSTLMRESKSATHLVRSVPTVDILSLFRDIINVVSSDYVVMKIDIEGAEYSLLRRIIIQGLLPLIDKIAIEWLVVIICSDLHSNQSPSFSLSLSISLPKNQN